MNTKNKFRILRTAILASVVIAATCWVTQPVQAQRRGFGYGPGFGGYYGAGPGLSISVGRGFGGAYYGVGYSNFRPANRFYRPPYRYAPPVVRYGYGYRGPVHYGHRYRHGHRGRWCY